MLILTRRPGESVRIGDDVIVTILSMKGNQVRLGIAAPRTVPVHRQEIYERILAEAGSPSPEGKCGGTRINGGLGSPLHQP